MNAIAKSEAPEQAGTAIALLPVKERAAVTLGTAEREKELRALALKHVGITAITNQDGRDDAHSAYMEIKSERVALEKAGKNAREDAAAFAKAVITEENRLIALITPEEERLKRLRDAWDEAEEKKRLEAAEAEIRRVTGHQSMIARIRALPQHALGKTSKELEELIESTRVTEIGATFEEFRVEAEDALRSTLAQLSVMLTGIRTQENEKAELERLRAAERERLAKEAEARAKADEAARAAAEAAEERRRAEIAAQEKELAEQRATQERELAARREEQARSEEFARQHREAEQARLAEERATLEREKAEAKARADKIEGAGQIFYAALLEVRKHIAPDSDLAQIINQAFANAGIQP